MTRWDLDKTYLRSDFYTARDLLRSALERPDQKRPVPGAARLLRELSQGATWVHLLSGSPKQLRKSITQRLALDGVRVDRMTLKPNLRNLVRLRFAALNDQLGYKLGALLQTRQHELQQWPHLHVPELLFGDDSEADAFVYSLYADVCSGAVEELELERILRAGETYSDQARAILGAAEAVRGCAQATDFTLLIHLDRQSPPSRFAGYGRRLVPFFNYAQAALVLFDRGFVEASSLFGVGLEMLEQHRFELDALARSFWDLSRRGFLSDSVLPRLESARKTAPTAIASLTDAIRAKDLRGAPLPRVQAQPVDYQELAREHRGGRNRA